MEVKDGIYQRRNSGATGSGNVVTKARVKDGIIIEAWYDVPGGEYRGNDPVGYDGQDAATVFEEESSPWKWHKVG